MRGSRPTLRRSRRWPAGWPRRSWTTTTTAVSRPAGASTPTPMPSPSTPSTGPRASSSPSSCSPRSGTRPRRTTTTSRSSTTATATGPSPSGAAATGTAGRSSAPRRSVTTRICGCCTSRSTRARHQVIGWWATTTDADRSAFARILCGTDPSTGAVQQQLGQEPDEATITDALAPGAASAWSRPSAPTASGTSRPRRRTSRSPSPPSTATSTTGGCAPPTAG